VHRNKSLTDVSAMLFDAALLSFHVLQRRVRRSHDLFAQALGKLHNAQCPAKMLGDQIVRKKDRARSWHVPCSTGAITRGEGRFSHPSSGAKI